MAFWVTGKREVINENKQTSILFNKFYQVFQIFVTALSISTSKNNYFR